MLLLLREVLKNDELRLVRGWLAHASFIDGRLSAGAAAGRVKRNEELDGRAAELERLNNVVMSRLTHHAGYRGGALPLHVAKDIEHV